LKLLDKLKAAAGAVGYFVVIPAMGAYLVVKDKLDDRRRERLAKREGKQ
jgi:hypothetical protein